MSPEIWDISTYPVACWSSQMRCRIYQMTRQFSCALDPRESPWLSFPGLRIVIMRLRLVQATLSFWRRPLSRVMKIRLTALSMDSRDKVPRWYIKVMPKFMYQGMPPQVNFSRSTTSCDRRTSCRFTVSGGTCGQMPLLRNKLVLRMKTSSLPRTVRLLTSHMERSKWLAKCRWASSTWMDPVSGT